MDALKRFCAWLLRQWRRDRLREWVAAWRAWLAAEFVPDETEPVIWWEPSPKPLPPIKEVLAGRVSIRGLVGATTSSVVAGLLGLNRSNNYGFLQMIAPYRHMGAGGAMNLTNVGTTTTSNCNLTTALLVHTQTNDTRIRKLYVNVFFDQVAGNGDYKAHLPIQRAGAGSAHISIRTTNALAFGETAGYIGSIPITLNATDVLKVYLLGVAGDTTTPDVIVDVNEET